MCAGSAFSVYCNRWWLPCGPAIPRALPPGWRPIERSPKAARIPRVAHGHMGATTYCSKSRPPKLRGTRCRPSKRQSSPSDLSEATKSKVRLQNGPATLEVTGSGWMSLEVTGSDWTTVILLPGRVRSHPKVIWKARGALQATHATFRP